MIALVPAGVLGHEEGVAVGDLVLQQLRHLRLRQMAVRLAQRPAFLVEDIGHALEEEHAEDVLLVFGRVHRAAQDVGGFHEEAFELGEGDLVG